MSDHASFLRAICAMPDDNAPRLIYADWLEEQGDVVQAEFIRVQCELHPYLSRLGFNYLLHGKKTKNQLRPLIQREQKAWNIMWLRWSEEISAVTLLPHTFQVGSNALSWFTCPKERTTFYCYFRRGFPNHVVCNLADWIGADREDGYMQCERCWRRFFRCVGEMRQCPYCREPDHTRKLAIPDHGTSLVTHWPIQQVHIHDAIPHHPNKGGYQWLCTPLYSLAGDSQLHSTVLWKRVGEGMVYKHKKDAHDALNKGCLNLARERARQRFAQVA